MVSAFSSINFGVGLEITEEQLKAINKYQENQKYEETEADTYLYGNLNKPILTENSFLHLLEHGQGKDRYWAYNHMVLQIEGVMDCMIVLFPGAFNPKSAGSTSVLNWTIVLVMPRTEQIVRCLLS